MIIDFHSHILPRVDHGSKDSAESEKQIELIGGFGTDAVVATSHFYPHVHKVEDFLEAVNGASERMSRLISGLERPKIYLGAEVLACEMIENMEGIESLCVRGTRCILLEMPSSSSWSRSLIRTVENLIDNGYTVILAHIDRYLKRFEEGIDALLSIGALAQINADSLVSFIDRKRLKPYIESGRVCALGSDLHGSDKKSYKPFADLEKHIGEERFRSIMKSSERLLEGAVTLTEMFE